VTETGIGGQFCGLQFRVSAGQIDRIACRVRRIVREWRKQHDFRPCRAPAIEDMRIGKTERIV
jgi:hypothetical protein